MTDWPKAFGDIILLKREPQMVLALYRDAGIGIDFVAVTATADQGPQQKKNRGIMDTESVKFEMET